MAKEEKHIIKQADITNNCTHCYNQELTLTFYQKHIFTAFFHKTTSEVTHKIECQKCGSIIYPVDWTPDIERVFEYYNKLVVPERKSIRFTLLFYGILVLVIALIATAIYLYKEGIL